MATHVDELMEQHVVTVSANDYAEDALLAMWRFGVTQAFVVDRDELVGVVHWHDLQRDSYTSRMDRDVREYMRPGLPIASPHTTMDEACRMLRSQGMESLPVMQERRLLGVISRRALRKAGQTETPRAV